MIIGMLWFDNDPAADLATKVARAATYYQNKYGQPANMCYVHPNMVQNNQAKPGGIELRSSRSVMPNHLWMGVSTEGE
jgi:hypothetical protein